MKKLLIIISMLFVINSAGASSQIIPLASINNMRIETKCVNHLLFVIVRNDRYMQVVQAYSPGNAKTDYIPQPTTCR